ncbi:MAG: hypothetical protein Q9164_006346 [Protoblastenia rupestris]
MSQMQSPSQNLNPDSGWFVTKDGRKVKIQCVLVPQYKPKMGPYAGLNPNTVAAVDRCYSDLIWYDPRAARNASMKHYLSDWADNARGIYYADGLKALDRYMISSDDPNDFDFYRSQVLDERQSFIPSFRGVHMSAPWESDRRQRACVAASHALRNEQWNKSEFAWDADARSDIFGQIKDDPLLDMDKREYSAHLAEVDPVTLKLTGRRTLVQRTPDATFALATYTPEVTFDIQDPALRTDRLERLLLHRKCGLISDPRWGHCNMVFPWAIYEAKGWSGDPREARRQACTGAKRYLNMLDHLARVPGPASTSARYQTETSHDFQVFAFTSFGSHWHVLVGCKHDRLAQQHAGIEGMSKNVTVSTQSKLEQRPKLTVASKLFRRIWSGSITNTRKAWELIYLVDQIQEWAKTTFRDWVIKHLRPWHEYCEENYLFDWDTDNENSKKPQSKKRKRRLIDDGSDVRLAKWSDFADPPVRAKAMARERAYLRAKLRDETKAISMRDEGLWNNMLNIVKRLFPPPAALSRRRQTTMTWIYYCEQSGKPYLTLDSPSSDDWDAVTED